MKDKLVKIAIKHKPVELMIPYNPNGINARCYWLAVAVVGNQSWSGEFHIRRLLMVRDKGLCKYFLWTGQDKGEAVYFIRKPKKIRRLNKQQVEIHYGIQIR